MNSDGEQTEDSDSSFPCFELIEYLDGVAQAFAAGVSADLVCIDSGSNRLVLIAKDDITDYREVNNRTLGTVDSKAVLTIKGIPDAV